MWPLGMAPHQFPSSGASCGGSNWALGLSKSLPEHRPAISRVPEICPLLQSEPATGSSPLVVHFLFVVSS